MVLSGTTVVCEQSGFENVVILVYLNVYMISHPPTFLYGTQTINKQISNKQNSTRKKEAAANVLKNTPHQKTTTHTWNNLPQDIRHSATLSSFKTQLKTFLFSEYFS